MVEKTVRDSFGEYQEFLIEEQNTRESIRETTKELEKQSKTLIGLLQGIHQSPSSENLAEITTNGIQTLEGLKPLFVELGNKVPVGEYFRFHDIWRFITTKLAFACSLIHYLKTDKIADRREIATMLGLGVDPRAASIYLDMEDYLQGLLQLTSELGRYAINCVANGDIQQPRKIFKVMGDLQQGFSELNLKNDHLRRMFDGLKYDVKKVEQVMYDIAVRGLDQDKEKPPSTI